MTTPPIHFIWTGGTMPDFAQANIDRCQAIHPDRDVILHGNEILWEPWKPAFDKQHIIARADLLKLSAARRIGGWVLDLDIWCLRPLDWYERICPGPQTGWWGTAETGCFGADPNFAWHLIDTLVDDLPVRRNAVFDLLQQLHAWAPERFNVTRPDTLVMMAHSNPGAYARMISGLPTSVRSALMLHGHRTTTPIPDSAIL